MARAPRTQTQDLAGTTQVTPASNFREGSFLVRPSKLSVDPNQFSSLSAQFAKLATTKTVAEDDVLFEKGTAEIQALQDTAAPQYTAAQKALAKAIREGRLEEQFSPAYVIAAKRQLGRSAQARANSLLEERIEQAATDALANVEGGIPPVVPTLEDMKSEVHDTIYNEIVGLNGGLADDFYFKSEYSKGRAASKEGLDKLHRDAFGEVDKERTRQEFGVSIQTAVKGANGLTGDELKVYMKDVQDGMFEMLVGSGVRQPLKLLQTNVFAAVRSIARTPGEDGKEPDKLMNVANAEEALTAFDNFKIAGTTLGTTNEFHNMWDWLAREESAARADGPDRLRKAVDDSIFEASQDPDGYWARLQTQSPAENSHMIGELRDMSPDDLSQALGEHAVAKLGDLMANASTIRRFEDGAVSNAITDDLLNGDSESAREKVSQLPVAEQAKARERIAKFVSEVETTFFRSTQYDRSVTEIRQSLEFTDNLAIGKESRTAALNFGANAVRAWSEDTAALLESAPIEEHPAILREAHGPRAEKVSERVKAFVDAEAATRADIGTKAEAFTQALDPAGLRKFLNGTNLTEPEKAAFNDRARTISDHNAASVRKASWAGLSDSLEQQLIGGLTGLPNVSEEFGTYPNVSTRVTPVGKRLMADVLDATNAKLSEWLATPEGMAARDGDSGAFVVTATRKIHEFSAEVLAEKKASVSSAASAAQSATEATELETALDQGEDAGPESAAGMHIRGKQLDQAGVQANQAAYGGNSSDWHTRRYNAGYTQLNHVLTGNLAREFNAQTSGYTGTMLFGLVKNQAFNVTGAGDRERRTRIHEEVLSQTFPVDGETLVRIAKSSAAGGFAYTPSPLAVKLMGVDETSGRGDEIGRQPYDVVGASMALREMGSLPSLRDTIRKQPDGWKGVKWEKERNADSSYLDESLSVSMAEALVDKVSRLKRLVAKDAKSILVRTAPLESTEHFDAMLLLSEVGGVSTEELLSGSFDNGLKILDVKRLDFGRVPHGFVDEVALSDFLDTPEAAKVLALFDLDITNPVDREAYEFSQYRLLYNK